jgi:glyoxylase-like metal-dependent hydrolase (beta-lactamase superfamily II)
METEVPPFSEELGHGITAIDTGYVRPQFDASHLVVERGHAAFVDVGTSFSAPRLVAALGAKGLRPEAVDYVIVTHVHLDHAGGAGEMMRRLPRARLVVHPRGARHMVDPSMLWAGASAVFGEEAVRRHYGAPVPVDPGRILEAPDGLTLELGGRPLRFLDTPGHARHHFCVWDEDSRSMFTGDTFGLAYPELVNQRGRWVTPTSAPVQFDPEPLKASVSRLLAREPLALCVTHFGRVPNAPHLGPLLASQIDEMAAIGQRCRRTQDRHAGLCDAMRAMYARRLAAHGFTDLEARLALLADDVEINAQGLGAWLDRTA